jgi:hypothetical protein
MATMGPVITPGSIEAGSPAERLKRITLRPWMVLILTLIGEVKEIDRIRSGSPHLWLHLVLAALLLGGTVGMAVTLVPRRR